MRVTGNYTLTGSSNKCVTGVTHALLAIDRPQASLARLTRLPASALAATEDPEHLRHLGHPQDGESGAVGNRARRQSDA